MASNNKQVEVAVEKTRKELVKLLSETPTLHPAFLHLAFSDAIAHNPRNKKHGPKGSIRFAHDTEDVQLKTAIDVLEKLKKEDSTINPYVSYADLYQLAGVEAMKRFGITIKFHHGREDSGSLVPDEFTRIHKGGDNATVVRSIFYRCGFNDQEIVALSSVITYWMNPNMFGDPTPQNSDLRTIYKILVKEKEKQDAGSSPTPQTIPTNSKSEPAASQSIISKTTSSMIHQDPKTTSTTNKIEATSQSNISKAVLQDPKTTSTTNQSEATSQSNVPNTPSSKHAQDTSTNTSNAATSLQYWKCLISDATFYKHVELFAKDRDQKDSDQFSEVYVSAHEKLSELGFRQFPNQVLELRDKQGIAIAVVVTILVGFLGFFYEVMRT